MDDPTPLPEYSKEDLDRVFEEFLAKVERLHDSLVSAAEHTGYIMKATRYVKPIFDDLYEISLDEPDAYGIVISGINFLMGMGNELNKFVESADALTSSTRPIADFMGTLAMTSGSAGDLWDLGHDEQPIPAPPIRGSRDNYSSKLYKLDPSLAKSYEQVWQTYLGTSSDSHRASLFMMRTLFDNFFARLAPDDEVRKSRFWQPKGGNNPNQIHRSERLAYALEMNVKDANRREILEAETEQILNLYKAANKAHDRGVLDEEKASRTLMAMDGFLRDWLDSID